MDARRRLFRLVAIRTIATGRRRSIFRDRAPRVLYEQSGSAGKLNVPTIGYGSGDESLAHRVDEHIDLTELQLGAVGYSVIATAIALPAAAYRRVVNPTRW